MCAWKMRRAETGLGVGGRRQQAVGSGSRSSGQWTARWTASTRLLSREAAALFWGQACQEQAREGDKGGKMGRELTDAMYLTFTAASRGGLEPRFYCVAERLAVGDSSRKHQPKPAIEMNPAHPAIRGESRLASIE